MGRKSRPTFKKRQKEIARQQRARDKVSRRMAKKDETELEPAVVSDEDPDIAGIQPGPQPLPDEWNYAPGHLPQAAEKKEATNDQPSDQKGEGES